MLHTHIVDALPIGVSRPLFARWRRPDGTTPWVRAGDLRREDAGLVMSPTWDGRSFATLWQAALGEGELDARDHVDFAIVSGTGLVEVASTPLTWHLRGRLRG